MMILYAFFASFDNMIIATRTRTTTRVVFG